VEKIENHVPTVDFWPALHKICGDHGNVKTHAHTNDISKFLRKMSEELLKVSESRLFKTLRKPCRAGRRWGGGKGGWALGVGVVGGGGVG